ncbi:hypothetical protein ACRRGD_001977 [Escherichia coli]
MDVYDDKLYPVLKVTFFERKGVVWKMVNGEIEGTILYSTIEDLQTAANIGLLCKRPANLEEEMLIDEVLK